MSTKLNIIVYAVRDKITGHWWVPSGYFSSSAIGPKIWTNHKHAQNAISKGGQMYYYQQYAGAKPQIVPLILKEL